MSLQQSQEFSDDLDLLDTLKKPKDYPQLSATPSQAPDKIFSDLIIYHRCFELCIPGDTLVSKFEQALQCLEIIS